MDYIAVIAEAVVAFVKNFDINAVVKAYTEIDWNGVRDAVLSAIDSLIKAIG